MEKRTRQVISFAEHLSRKSPGVVNGIGLCSIFSRQGDWAFDYALSLARHHRTKLNIFHFLESPYVLRRDLVFVDAARKVTARATPDLIARKDKELREAFEERLGDYEDVGFRLCEGNDEFELRKCFRKSQYEILVIGYKEKGAAFGGTTTVEAFADKFRGPVVLVGPDSPDSYHLNAAAEGRLADLLIPDGR
ncbi:MAG TPA: hypothetical protein VMC85_02785, partial [Desulfomonilaceae bacterium]|nr:hypothetical protein [Desulfomonilaceae bacterium]